MFSPPLSLPLSHTRTHTSTYTHTHTYTHTLLQFESGTVLLAGQLADALATPIVGLASVLLLSPCLLARVCFQQQVNREPPMLRDPRARA